MASKMRIFKSQYPDVEIPTDLTIWQWLFESSYSPLHKHADCELGGFIDFATKERIGWQGVRRYATHISTALVKKYAMQAGETMSLFSRNTVWYPVMLHAVTRVGGIISGASPAYGVDEMAYALRTANARFIATSHTSIDIAVQAAKQADIPRERIFLLEGSLPGFTTIHDLIALGASYGEADQVPSFHFPRGKTSADVCAFLSFSSGTTGLPKAVMISHGNMIAQVQQMAPFHNPNHRRVLAVLPFFHITGLVFFLHYPIILNCEVIMLPAFTMPTMLAAISEHKIVETLLVPPILIRLLRDPVVEQYDLSCIQRFSSGAAPVSPEVMSQLDARFPGTGFRQGYGMTESTACVTAHPMEISTWAYSHTVGRVIPNTELRILKEEDGQDGDVDEPGEILARGPQVTMGYLDRPDATKDSFDADGWLHTGDRGFMDAEGCLHVTDRIKELIKVNGIAVAPAELEDVLLGHREIDDVAVVGISDANMGERPKAFVVLKHKLDFSSPSSSSPSSSSSSSSPSSSPSSSSSTQLPPHLPPQVHELASSIFTYIRTNRVRPKWLAEIEFIDVVPKSPSGKILRRELRKLQGQGVGVAGNEEGVVGKKGRVIVRDVDVGQGPGSSRGKEKGKEKEKAKL